MKNTFYAVVDGIVRWTGLAFVAGSLFGLFVVLVWATFMAFGVFR